MKRVLLYTLLVAQLSGLVALYLWHAAGLGNPTVMLKTLPVDPRDPLRGDYVVLDYEISRLPADQKAELDEGREVFVVLQEVDGFAAIARVALWMPAPGERFIRGRVRAGRILYDLERYFVPEGKGNPPRPVTVEVALRGDGRPQIKQLYAKGVPWP